MNRIQKIEHAIHSKRKQLTDHPLYAALDGVDDIRIFMEHHVFAVWDFMSLLKALQAGLTCVEIPWKPAANAVTARFINEIVLGEETDVNEQGVVKSHFEMYLDAMTEVQANTQSIQSFVDGLKGVDQLLDQLDQASILSHVQDFLQYTFEVIQSRKMHKIAAAFTFGREDLIPDMFLEIIANSRSRDSKAYPALRYYLERHIELDGDEHGPLSLAMVEQLCGNDAIKWAECEEVALESLDRRIQLWDGILQEIQEKKLVLV